MDEYIDSILNEIPEVTAHKGAVVRTMVCTKCGIAKELSAYGRRYDSISRQCKACVNAAQKANLAKSEFARLSKREANKQWAANNPDKIKEKQQRYQPIANARMVERRQTEPEFRLASSMRNRVGKLLRGECKSAPSMELLGCSVTYLQRWLESQFANGMAWDNYGAYWEIDHVRPCAGYDLTLATAQQECFSWRNMRPTTVHENRSKNKYGLDADTLANHEQRSQQWLNIHPDTYTK